MPNENYGGSIKQIEGNKNFILDFRNRIIMLTFISYFQISEAWTLTLKDKHMGNNVVCEQKEVPEFVYTLFIQLQQINFL